MKFFLQSGQAAEFPEGVGLPVFNDLLQPLHRGVPQALQGKEVEVPQPDENLHISNFDKHPIT